MKVALRVVVADDSYLVREGLAALMRETDEIELVGAAESLPTLMEAVERLRPEAVITDIRMPPTNTSEGIVAAREIRERYRTTGVLVLSQHLEEDYVRELLQDGSEFLGYFLKERVGNLAELVRALHLVAGGGSALDPVVIDRLLTSNSKTQSSELETLTEREQDVLRLMAEGRTNAAIAEALFLGERAVEKHVSAIFQKLTLTEESDVHRRVTAVLKYLQAAGEGRAATRTPPRPFLGRRVTTLLFTDIVGSTQRAAKLGDDEWGNLLGSHHELVRRELNRYRGIEVETAGDGFLAVFDAPARAIRCAWAIRDAVARLGIHLRFGIHTGEIEMTASEVRGLGVHIGARIVAMAAPDEVFVSSTVKDLAAGGGFEFTHRGEHELRGVPGTWNVFAVT